MPIITEENLPLLTQAANELRYLCAILCSVLIADTLAHLWGWQK